MLANIRCMLTLVDESKTHPSPSVFLPFLLFFHLLPSSPLHLPLPCHPSDLPLIEQELEVVKVLEFCILPPTSSNTPEIIVTNPGRMSSSKECLSALPQFSLSLGGEKEQNVICRL